MRTITFRGLRTDGKGWVYGGYFQHTPDEDGVRYYIFDFNEGAVEVMPESVGQFTGLHDKNGKEIYEGDIIKFSQWALGSYSEKISVKSTGIAEWSLNKGKWFIENDLWDLGIFSDREVIGSIYENPELLEK